MTAQILVVDDVPANIKLLEARLASEYYDVLTAKDGFEALDVAKQRKPDLILLDVMMPGMDGFEVCKRLKQDNEISHIPVVMVTALSDQSDRIRGLEAGADDFLTKPINDTALFARVRSLVRIKVLLDELRMRDQTREKLGIATENSFTADVSNSRILLIDDDIVQVKQLQSKLSESYQVEVLQDPADAVEKAATGNYDLIMVSTLLSEIDGLRLATQIKNREEIRNVPILTLVDEDDDRIMLKGLEIGMSDYLRVPVDKNEMQARVKTNIRRKRYQDALKNSYQQSISMAISDSLTGLYNRHYLSTRLDLQFQQALTGKRPLSLMILDMDHFKSVNDTHGHDAGDLCLKQLAKIMLDEARSSDLVARYGGEEFVVLLSETSIAAVRDVSERLRKKIEDTPFVINETTGQTIQKTVSIGVSCIRFNEGQLPPDTPADLLKRADIALYQAKHSGRNRVVIAE